MPTYDYRCKDCGATHEMQHGFNDERPTTCPTCGGRLTRVFHPVGVVFKGSGFHKTDYSSTGRKPAPAEPAKTETTGKTEAPATDSKPSTPAKTDSSPAPKKEPRPSGPS